MKEKKRGLDNRNLIFASGAPCLGISEFNGPMQSDREWETRLFHCLSCCSSFHLMSRCHFPRSSVEIKVSDSTSDTRIFFRRFNGARDV